MISIIIQARIGATRLPQKMSLSFWNGMSMLEILFIRLNEAGFNIPVIVATTTNDCDNFIENLALKHNIQPYRGDEHHVLMRFIDAAKFYQTEKIIRICADNPLLDMDALRFQIQSFSTSDVDYWCYSLKDATPTIKTHYGFWTEGVTLEALEKVAATTNEKIYQEHVTNYIYANPEKFKLHFERISDFVENNKSIRLTVDTIQDFELSKIIYAELMQKNIALNAESIVSYVAANQAWISIMNKEMNKNVK